MSKATKNRPAPRTFTVSITVSKEIAEVLGTLRTVYDRPFISGLAVAMAVMPNSVMMAVRDLARAVDEKGACAAFANRKAIQDALGEHLSYWLDDIGDTRNNPRARKGMKVAVAIGGTIGQHHGTIMECGDFGAFVKMNKAGDEPGMTWKEGEILPFMWGDIDLLAQQHFGNQRSEREAAAEKLADTVREVGMIKKSATMEAAA